MPPQLGPDLLRRRYVSHAAQNRPAIGLSETRILALIVFSRVRMKRGGGKADALVLAQMVSTA